jgi:Na+-transporting methylmalonyl-CoA/oxaloacetate decarboxylase beta subunit
MCSFRWSFSDCCIVLVLPMPTPLIGALMFGNIIRESGVTERLSRTLQSAMIDSVTIMLGLVVGSKLQAAYFLRLETLGIVVLGLIAFSASERRPGCCSAQLMNKLSRTPINPADRRRRRLRRSHGGAGSQQGRAG